MVQVGKCVDTFDAPIGEVWAVISAIGAEKLWIEGVLKVSLEGAGLGALRTLTFKDFVAQEVIEKCDPKTHCVIYRLLDPAPIPVKRGVGTMQLTAISPEKTRIDWNSIADAIEGDIAAVQEQISAMYQQSCQNIKRFIGC